MSYRIAKNLNEEVFLNFTYSDVFKRLYDEGISLINETIVYLENLAKPEIRRLTEEQRWIYSIESMDLTTRLMQITSWFMLQHSVVQGKMTFEEACSSKYRLLPEKNGHLNRNLSGFPERFIGFVKKIDALLMRIRRLDINMYAKNNQNNMVLEQIDYLKSEFQKTS